MLIYVAIITDERSLFTMKFIALAEVYYYEMKFLFICSSSYRKQKEKQETSSYLYCNQIYNSKMSNSWLETTVKWCAQFILLNMKWLYIYQSADSKINN